MYSNSLNSSTYNSTTLFRYFPLKKAQPIAWLVELLGPSSSTADLDDFFLKSGRRSGGRTGSRGGTGLGSGGKGVCVHEEGGRYAIFESNNGDPVSLERLTTRTIVH